MDNSHLITDKELRDAYSLLTKEVLIGILIDKRKEVRSLQSSQKEPAEVSEEITITLKKDDLNECHYFEASNMYDWCKRKKISIKEPRNSRGLFDKFIITLKTPEQKILFYGKYIDILKKFQSHQVSQEARPTDRDYKAKYEKCISVIKKFDAGIIGMYDL